jgi:hypothetical protein
MLHLFAKVLKDSKKMCGKMIFPLTISQQLGGRLSNP